MLSLKRFTDQPTIKLAAQKAALEAATAETAKTAKAEAKSVTETAKKLLDTSAEKNRNLLIALMAYLATATILCLSITDLDLLVDQKNHPTAAAVRRIANVGVLHSYSAVFGAATF